MAVLTVGTVDRAGFDNDSAGANYAAAGGSGDSFPNTGVEVVEIYNNSGAGITVTFDIQSTVDGQTVTDRTVTIANGGRKICGPFPTGIYNDGNGRCIMTYSSSTSVKVCVRKPTTS